MNLLISRLFTQVGISFDISHKVTLFIKKMLVDHIITPYHLDKRDVGTSLSLIIGTKKECQSVEVIGPFLDGKNQCITWHLLLPYDEIAGAVNSTEVFIERFFDAAQRVFQNYDVKVDDLQNVRRIVKLEVIGNEEYKYSKVQLKPPDLSKFKV